MSEDVTFLPRKHLDSDTGFLFGDVRINEKQRHELNSRIGEAIDKHGLETPFRIDISYKCHYHLDPKSGFDITYHVSDGEVLLDGWLDVYGNGSSAVGRVEWIDYPED